MSKGFHKNLLELKYSRGTVNASITISVMTKVLYQPKRMFIALKVSTIITFAKHFSDRNSILVYILYIMIVFR